MTGFGTLPIGNLQLRVTPAGSKDVIFDSPPQNYSERASFEIVVYSRGSSTLANVALLNIDGAGSGIDHQQPAVAIQGDQRVDGRSRP